MARNLIHEDNALDSVGTAVISLDKKFLDVDDRFCEILGYNQDELLDISWERISLVDDLKKESACLRSLQKNKINNLTINKRFQHKTGKIVLASISVKCIRCGNKSPECFLVLAHDITDRKRMEQEPQNLQDYNRKLIEVSLDPLVTFDQDGIVLDVNQATIQVTGRSREQLIGSQFADYFKDSDKAQKAVKLVFKQGKVRDYELIIKAIDGLETAVACNASVFRDASGEVIGAFAAARDITGRKKSEEIQSILFQISQAVSASIDLQEFLEIVHQQFGRLIDTDNFYVALYDEESDSYSFPCHYDEFEKSADYSKQKLKRSLTDYVRRTGKSLLADETIHQELIRKGEVDLIGEPSPIWLGVPLRTSHGVIGVVAVQSYSKNSLYSMQDLEMMSFIAENISLAIEYKRVEAKLATYHTRLEELVRERTEQLTQTNRELEKKLVEHRQTEEALRDSERRMSEIIDFLPDATFVVNRDSQVIAWNKAMQEMTGIPADEMLHKSNYEYAVPFYGKRRPILIDKIFESHSETDSLYTAIRHEHETIIGEAFTPALGSQGRYLYATARALFDSQGEFAGAIESIRDVTESRRAGEELRASEERFRDLVLSTSDWVWEVDTHGCYTYCSGQIANVLGYTAEEILGKTPFDLMPPEERTRTSSIFNDIVENLAPIVELENWNISKDGRKVCLLTNGLPMFDETGCFIGYRGLDRDITSRKEAEAEKRKLEKQLLQTQKLESLGVLAGGIAHDFNNLLVGILGNADLALDSLSPVSPARTNISEIETAAKRAAELSRQMLAYSGKGQFVIDIIDINDILREMTHLLKVSISKKAVLRLDLVDNIPAVKADVTQMRQIVMNLLTNASEAIGDRSGMITITTGAIECSDDYFDGTYFKEDLKEGVYTYFEISDTGYGMNVETQSRIFDPFFTTKVTGRGLGLAAVLGIVRGHGGTLKLYSEEGRGTTFIILLPAVERRAESLNKETASALSWKSSGTILLVDDEETVRAVGTSMLERLGFTVLTAADGRDAVTLFSKNPDEIRCVILDLTMPHMSGEEAFRELKLIRSDINILLSSGYNEKYVLDRFTGRQIDGFIQKPYRCARLASKLREILEK